MREPENAVVAAVGLGGDADTIGSMCGAICGALYGRVWIPARWFDAIENDSEHGRDYAVDLAAKLALLDLHLPLKCVVNGGRAAITAAAAADDADDGDAHAGGGGDGGVISTSSWTDDRGGASPATCRRESEEARGSAAYKSVEKAYSQYQSPNPVDRAAGSSLREFAAAAIKSKKF